MCQLTQVSLSSVGLPSVKLRRRLQPKLLSFSPQGRVGAKKEMQTKTLRPESDPQLHTPCWLHWVEEEERQLLAKSGCQRIVVSQKEEIPYCWKGEFLLVLVLQSWAEVCVCVFNSISVEHTVVLEAHYLIVVLLIVINFLQSAGRRCLRLIPTLSPTKAGSQSEAAAAGAAAVRAPSGGRRSGKTSPLPRTASSWLRFALGLGQTSTTVRGRQSPRGSRLREGNEGGTPSCAPERRSRESNLRASRQRFREGKMGLLETARGDCEEPAMWAEPGRNPPPSPASAPHEVAPVNWCVCCGVIGAVALPRQAKRRGERAAAPAACPPLSPQDTGWERKESCRFSRAEEQPASWAEMKGKDLPCSGYVHEGKKSPPSGLQRERKAGKLQCVLL